MILIFLISIESNGFNFLAASHELCHFQLQMGDFSLKWSHHQGNHPGRLWLGCNSLYSKIFFDGSIIKLNYGTQKANLDETGSILL
jgi:hypothetical protein